MSTTPNTDTNADNYVVAHATNLLADDVHVFEHSVAIARAADSPIYTLHAVDNKHGTLEMPEVEPLLARWGGKDVSHHRVRHKCCEDTIDTLLDGLRLIEPDLLVVGKNQGEGLSFILEESVSEAIARNIHIPTLVLPTKSSGFVNPRNGAIKLERVLIPAEDEETFLLALRHTMRLLDKVEMTNVQITALHIGKDIEGESLVLPEDPNIKIDVKLIEGNLVDSIVDVAAEGRFDMITMATRGHDSLLDVARGSHTERVLRNTNVPVMVIPVHASHAHFGLF